MAISAPTVAYGLFRDILPRRYIPASIGVIATGLALAAAFLNAAFDYCLGCEVYLLFRRSVPRRRAAAQE